MATRNIYAITGNMTGNNSNAYSWSFQAAYTAMNDNQNPQFNRTCTLTPTGILLTVGGNSAGIPIAVFTQAMAKICPAVTWPPVVEVQPSNSTVGWGNNTSFSTNFSDELGGDITYQWVFASNNADVPASAPYSNVTTANLSISNSAWLSGNGYYCVATNPSGNNSSNIAYLTTDPNITNNPSNSTVAANGPTNFAVAATGLTTLSYQWQSNSGAGFSNLSNSGVYSNVTTAAMNISNTYGLNGYQFRCLVSDSNGVATSNAATFLT